MSMKSSSTLKIVVFALAAFMAREAQSAVITYVEGPDLSNNVAAPTALGNLDVGLNTIRGGIGPVSFESVDAAQLNLPGGLNITSISVAITNYAVMSGAQFFTGIGANPLDVISFGGNGVIPVPAARVAAINAAGAFSIGVRDITPTSEELGWSYTISINVEQAGMMTVPEPGTFAIWSVLGLVGACWFRKRRSA